MSKVQAGHCELNVEVPEPVRRRLQLALDRSTSVKALLHEALQMLFEREHLLRRYGVADQKSLPSELLEPLSPLAEERGCTVRDLIAESIQSTLDAAAAKLEVRKKRESVKAPKPGKR